MSGWDRTFSDAIVLESGEELRRLRDAGAYIVRLPAPIYRTEPWRVATHLLIQAAEYDVPVELARLAVMCALYPSCAESDTLEAL